MPSRPTYMTAGPLSEKQQKFVDAYDGNAGEAARIAGYADWRFEGPHLLKMPKIRVAIEERTAGNRAALEKERAALIATREKRQEFWTSVMNDVNADMSDRLKASELLGKSEADFTDKIRGEGEGMGGVIILPAKKAE